MESILFDNYREYIKSKKGNILKAIFKLPAFAIILFIVLVLCVTFSILSIFIPWFTDNYIYCLITEIALCVILYFYTEHF